MAQRTNKASNKRAFKLGLKNIREAEDSIEEEDIPVESDETDVGVGEDIGETIVELVKSYADKFTDEQKEAIASVTSDSDESSEEDDLDENVIREDEDSEDEDSEDEDEDLDEDEEDSLTESRARKIREARARVRRNIARRKMMEARKLKMARRAAMNESIRNRRISESRAAKVASLRRRLAARKAALSERV